MATSDECCDSNPNFAIICSFISKFGDDCGITATIPFLQKMLEDTKNVAEELKDIHIHLLRKGRKRVTKEKWERSLVKFCHEYSSVDAWELERFGYKKAKLSVKLELLKRLLELQFDSNAKFKAEVNKHEASTLRVIPIGRDVEGHMYWYQLDKDCNMRLYKQNAEDENFWQLMCSSKQDLENLIMMLERKCSKTKEEDTAFGTKCESLNSDENMPTVKELDETLPKEREIPGKTEDDLKASLSPTKSCTIIIKAEKNEFFCSYNSHMPQKSEEDNKNSVAETLLSKNLATPQQCVNSEIQLNKNENEASTVEKDAINILTTNVDSETTITKSNLAVTLKKKTPETKIGLNEHEQKQSEDPETLKVIQEKNVVKKEISIPEKSCDLRETKLPGDQEDSKMETIESNTSLNVTLKAVCEPSEVKLLKKMDSVTESIKSTSQQAATPISNKKRVSEDSSSSKKAISEKRKSKKEISSVCQEAPRVGLIISKSKIEKNTDSTSLNVDNQQSVPDEMEFSETKIKGSKIKLYEKWSKEKKKLAAFQSTTGSSLHHTGKTSVITPDKDLATKLGSCASSTTSKQESNHTSNIVLSDRHGKLSRTSKDNTSLDTVIASNYHSSKLIKSEQLCPEVPMDLSISSRGKDDKDIHLANKTTSTFNSLSGTKLCTEENTRIGKADYVESTLNEDSKVGSSTSLEEIKNSKTQPNDEILPSKNANSENSADHVISRPFKKKHHLIMEEKTCLKDIQEQNRQSVICEIKNSILVSPKLDEKSSENISTSNIIQSACNDPGANSLSKLIEPEVLLNKTEKNSVKVISNSEKSNLDTETLLATPDVSTLSLKSCNTSHLKAINEKTFSEKFPMSTSTLSKEYLKKNTQDSSENLIAVQDSQKCKNENMQKSSNIADLVGDEQPMLIDSETKEKCKIKLETDERCAEPEAELKKYHERISIETENNASEKTGEEQCETQNQTGNSQCNITNLEGIDQTQKNQICMKSLVLKDKFGIHSAKDNKSAKQLSKIESICDDTLKTIKCASQKSNKDICSSESSQLDGPCVSSEDPNPIQSTAEEHKIEKSVFQKTDLETQANNQTKDEVQQSTQQISDDCSLPMSEVKVKCHNRNSDNKSLIHNAEDGNKCSVVRSDDENQISARTTETIKIIKHSDSILNSEASCKVLLSQAKEKNEIKAVEPSVLFSGKLENSTAVGEIEIQDTDAHDPTSKAESVTDSSCGEPNLDQQNTLTENIAITDSMHEKQIHIPKLNLAIQDDVQETKTEERSSLKKPEEAIKDAHQKSETENSCNLNIVTTEIGCEVQKKETGFLNTDSVESNQLSADEGKSKDPSKGSCINIENRIGNLEAESTGVHDETKTKSPCLDQVTGTEQDRVKSIESDILVKTQVLGNDGAHVTQKASTEKECDSDCTENVVKEDIKIKDKFSTKIEGEDKCKLSDINIVDKAYVPCTIAEVSSSSSNSECKISKTTCFSADLEKKTKNTVDEVLSPDISKEMHLKSSCIEDLNTDNIKINRGFENQEKALRTSVTIDDKTVGLTTGDKSVVIQSEKCETVSVSGGETENRCKSLKNDADDRSKSADTSNNETLAKSCDIKSVDECLSSKTKTNNKCKFSDDKFEDVHIDTMSTDVINKHISSGISDTKCENKCDISNAESNDKNITLNTEIVHESDIQKTRHNETDTPLHVEPSNMCKIQKTEIGEKLQDAEEKIINELEEKSKVQDKEKHERNNVDIKKVCEVKSVEICAKSDEKTKLDTKCDVQNEEHDKLKLKDLHFKDTIDFKNNASEMQECSTHDKLIMESSVESAKDKDCRVKSPNIKESSLNLSVEGCLNNSSIKDSSKTASLESMSTEKNLKSISFDVEDNCKNISVNKNAKTTALEESKLEESPENAIVDESVKSVKESCVGETTNNDSEVLKIGDDQNVKLQEKETVQHQIKSDEVCEVKKSESEKNCEIASEKHCNKKAENNCEIEPEKGCKIESKKNSEVQSEKNHKVETEKNREVEIEKNREVETEKNREVETEKNCELKTEKNCELETEKNCEVEPEKNCEVEPEKNCEVEPEKNCEVETEKNCEVETEKNCEVETEKNCEVETEKNCEVESEKNREVESGKNCEIEPEKNFEMKANEVEDSCGGKNLTEESFKDQKSKSSKSCGIKKKEAAENCEMPKKEVDKISVEQNVQVEGSCGGQIIETEDNLQKKIEEVQKKNPEESCEEQKKEIKDSFGEQGPEEMNKDTVKATESEDKLSDQKEDVKSKTPIKRKGFRKNSRKKKKNSRLVVAKNQNKVESENYPEVQNETVEQEFKTTITENKCISTSENVKDKKQKKQLLSSFKEAEIKLSEKKTDLENSNDNLKEKELEEENSFTSQKEKFAVDHEGSKTSKMLSVKNKKTDSDVCNDLNKSDTHASKMILSMPNAAAPSVSALAPVKKCKISKRKLRSSVNMDKNVRSDDDLYRMYMLTQGMCWETKYKNKFIDLNFNNTTFKIKNYELFGLKLDSSICKKNDDANSAAVTKDYTSDSTAVTKGDAADSAVITKDDANDSAVIIKDEEDDDDFGVRRTRGRTRNRTQALKTINRRKGNTSAVVIDESAVIVIDDDDVPLKEKPTGKGKALGRNKAAVKNKTPVKSKTPVKDKLPAKEEAPKKETRNIGRGKRTRGSSARNAADFTLPEGFLEIIGSTKAKGRTRRQEPAKKVVRSTRQKPKEASLPSSENESTQSTPIKRSRRIQEQTQKKMSELAVEMEMEQRRLEQLAKRKTTPQTSKAKPKETPAKSKLANTEFQPPIIEDACMETKRSTRKRITRCANMAKLTLMYEDDSTKDSEYSTSRETEKSRKRRNGRGRRRGYKPWDLSSESSTSFEEFTEEEEEEPEERLVFHANEDEFACEEVEEDAEPVVIRRARTAKKATEDESELEPIVAADDKPCGKCGKHDRPEWILLCDKCDNGYHTNCLIPPIMNIPDGDWYCQPCEHLFLCECLHEELHKLDQLLKQKEREELRKQRLAYVGISLDNVLKPEKKEESSSSSEDNKVQEKVETYEKECFEEDVNDKVYGKRSVRARRNVNYRFKEFDELIASAIGDELVGVKYEEEFKAAAALEEALEEEGNSDESFIGPPAPKKKRTRGLNDLDYSDEDDNDNDDEYKGLSTDTEHTPSANSEDFRRGSDAASGEWRIVKTRSKRRSRKGRLKSSGDESENGDDDAYRPITRRAAQKKISYRELSSEEEWGEELKISQPQKRKKKESTSEDSEESYKGPRSKSVKKTRVTRKWNDSSSESEKSMSESEDDQSSRQSAGEWKIRQKINEGGGIKININKKMLGSDSDTSSKEYEPKKRVNRLVSDDDTDEDEEEDEDEETSSESESEKTSDSEDAQESINEKVPSGEKTAQSSEKVATDNEKVAKNGEKIPGNLEKDVSNNPKVESSNEKIKDSYQKVADSVRKAADSHAKIGSKIAIVTIIPKKVSEIRDNITVCRQNVAVCHQIVGRGSVPVSHEKPTSSQVVVKTVVVKAIKEITKMVPSKIAYKDKLETTEPEIKKSVRTDKECTRREKSSPRNSITVTPINIPLNKSLPVIVQSAPKKDQPQETQVVKSDSKSKAFTNPIIEPFTNVDEDRIEGSDSQEGIPLERITGESDSIPDVPYPGKSMLYDKESEYRPAKEGPSFQYSIPEEKSFPSPYSALASLQDFTSRPTPLKPSLVETYPNNSSPSKLTPLDSYSQSNSPKGFISLDSYPQPRKKRNLFGNPPIEPEIVPRPIPPIADHYQGEIRFPQEPFPCPSSPSAYQQRSLTPQQRDPGTPPRLYSQFPDAYAPPRSPEYYHSQHYYPPEEGIPRPSYQPNYAPMEHAPPYPYLPNPIQQPNGGFMIDTLLRARNPENEEDELTGVTDIVSYITQE